MKAITSLLIALLLLGGCARYTAPPYTPPDQRAVANSELPWPSGQVLAIGYHDVTDSDPDNNFMAVRTANLVMQLAWLRENGYQAVSVEQILAARNDGPPLPDKAVLLTFDDGFSSFAERVLPILRAYQWPAVLAPVGEWLRTPDDQLVDFGGLPVPRDFFASREQLIEIHASGLVEIAAHTDNLHFGHIANPQGNLQPAAATLRYLASEQRYETREEYQARIHQDVAAITQMLKDITGQAPRVWVWPYGAANGLALEIIKDQGYEMALTLQRGLSAMSDINSGPRLLLSGDPSIDQFTQQITGIQEEGAKRVVHVDLDYIYDPDPAQQEANIGQLVQRIADMRITTVYLQAYADPKGDGTVRELYFPNRHLPMRADLFNRVAWQLFTRAGVDIYAWMPVLSFALNEELPPVMRHNPHSGIVDVDPDQYQRLSPFNSRTRQIIGEIYEDLALHASFNGILFHDDALLSDYEDVSPDALNAYQHAGFGTDVLALRADEEQLWAWSRFKSRYLTAFTLELADKVRAVRGPQVKTARNIFAQPIINPYSETWFAQNLDDFLQAYDWTAPMAMPLMEGVPAAQSNAWLANLVAQVAARPGALDKTLFELQARDWSSDPVKPVSDDQLADWIRVLQWQGVRHFGYYPDDVHQQQPDLDMVRSRLSNAWSPQP